MRKDPGINSFAINLSTERETSKCEPGRGQGKTCALVDVGAGHPSAREARVACACEGAVGICARRVGVAVVGPICDRGASHHVSRAPACQVRCGSMNYVYVSELLGPRHFQAPRTSAVGAVCYMNRLTIVPRLICPPNVAGQTTNWGVGRAGPVHSSMLTQETPVPEKPVLHAHVKAPSVSVHAALVSQLWVPSAMEGRGPSTLLSSSSVSG